MTNREFSYPTITHSCEICRMEFQVSCFSELQDKLRKHKCIKVNKRVERTAQLQQNQIDQFVEDTVVDRIHQYKFDQLVRRGIFVHA